MCTLILAWRVFADAPVVVAANRDEAVDRPSTPPERRDGDPVVVAPRDGRAGGTWVGYNEAGVFVGVSNRWTDRDLPAGRSRGLLVADALGQRSTDDVAGAVEDALVTDRYEGFNLLVADAESAVILEWDGRLSVTELDPGLHVMMNAGYDDAFRLPGTYADAARGQERTARAVRRTLAVEPDETAAGWLDRAAAVLADHEHGVCVHGDGYGTRSSSLIALHVDGTATYQYADGPPCETPFEPVNGQS